MVKKRGKKTGNSISKTKSAGKSSAKSKTKAPKKKGIIVKRTLKRSSSTERLKSTPLVKPIIHKKKRFKENKSTQKLSILGLAGKSKIRQPNYGVKLVVGYTGFLALLYLIYFIVGLINPSFIVLRAENSFIIDLIMLAWVFGVLYGFHNRKKWAWKLSMGWFAFMVLYSIMLMRYLRQGTYNLSTELFTIAILSIVLVNAFIIWYIYKKKSYFVGEDHGVHYNKEDKIFVYTIVCFWVLLLAISASIGMNFYSDTKEMTNNLMLELSHVVPSTGFEGGVSMCNAKGQPERDICYVILTAMADGDQNYCEKIDSHIYKFTCLQAREP